MKLSDNYQVQRLVTRRSDLHHKLYAVSNEKAGFGISFNGTGEGGDALKIAQAALVPHYQGLIEEIDHELRDLGVNPDD